MENVLAAYLAFRDSVSDEEFCRLMEQNEKLEALMDALMDMEVEEG